MPKMRTDFNQCVPMRDGVELSADIYRPDDDTRHPVVLYRTPYLKTAEILPDRARKYVEAGYVVVWMDVRGRGDSDGKWVPYRNEGRDGYDSIEWCAAQPWSDGNVGTMGGSYLGRIQWLAALENPPHLRAMIAAVTPSDPFVEWPTGTPGPMHLCWLHLTAGRVTQNMRAVDWNSVYEHLPLATMDDAAGRHSEEWREQCRHEHLDDYWKALRYQDKFERIAVPVLHVSGWYDDEQVGTPLNFIGMTTRAATPEARRGQKLLMGPWSHQINTTTKLGEVDFGPDAQIDLDAYQIRWLDRWLKGQPTGIDEEPAARIFVMGANRWRDEAEWPLACTQWTPYYFHGAGHANSRFGDGGLSPETPSEELADTYTYDPARPVPFITEPTSSQIGGPDDYAAIQRRDDVLVYATPPLERDTEVTGPIKVILHAASSARDTDFTAMLLDFHPSGFAQRLTDGLVRARFREGMGHPTLIEPGTIYRYEIDCWNTAQVFRAGHRISVQIASSAFPKYDRNLNTGESLTGSARIERAEQRIYHDAAHPSHILLPIIPAEE
jgi:putative CocE/NonD family hydrolase